MCGERRENPYARCAVEEGADGASYRLVGPRGSGGCAIIEVDGYLGVFGDLSPRDNRGVWSLRGYSLEWFIGVTEEPYLASKFLRRFWQPDIAESEVRFLRDQAAAIPKAWPEVSVAGLTKLITNRVWNDGEETFLRCCMDAGVDVSASAPGYGYATQDVILLAGLREKLAEHVRQKTAPPMPAPTPARARRPTNLGQHMRPGLRRS